MSTPYLVAPDIVFLACSHQVRVMEEATHTHPVHVTLVTAPVVAALWALIRVPYIELDTVLWLKTTPETKSPVAIDPIDIPEGILNSSNASGSTIHTMASRADIVLEEDVLTIIDSNTIVLVLNHYREIRQSEVPEEVREDRPHCSSQ